MCEETEPVHASTHFHETGCCVVDSLLNHVNNVEDDSGTVLVTRDLWFYSKNLSFHEMLQQNFIPGSASVPVVGFHYDLLKLTSN